MATSHAVPTDSLEPHSRADRPLRRDAERNRQRILEAAREAFAHDGLSVTLDEIGRRAGVGVGTVYRRFPDKDQLIEALFEDRMNEFVALADECLGFEDAWDGLVHFLEPRGPGAGLRSRLQRGRALGVGRVRSVLASP